jgi:regulator of replication initiation timing
MIVAILASAALVLAACGEDEPIDDAGAQERIEELEAELDETREEAARLLEENEQLHEQVRELREDETDEPDPEADATEDEEPDEEVDDDPPAAAPQPERTPEGLHEQLRTLFERDEPEDFDPGTTDWTSAEHPEGLEDAYDSPGALAFDLAAVLDAPSLGMDTWETTTRVLLDEDDPDVAYVAVLSWGFADDAVAGRDYRMTITHDDGAWTPGGAEERFHCRRGVTDDDLCV